VTLTRTRTITRTITIEKEEAATVIKWNKRSKNMQQRRQDRITNDFHFYRNGCSNIYSYSGNSLISNC